MVVVYLKAVAVLGVFRVLLIAARYTQHLMNLNVPLHLRILHREGEREREGEGKGEGEGEGEKEERERGSE